ncbi:MAG: hypothetical protein AB7P14_26840 [Blastocatellales bacterium]
MNLDTTQLMIAGGALLALVFLYLIWKFFFSLIKHFIIVLILGGIFAGAYWYKNHIPRKVTAIGKHAYLTESGKYLGVVESEGEDDRRGEVWNIRFPGSYPRMYSKSRVTLKDQRDLASEPTPTPTQAPKTSPTAPPKATKATSRKK